MSATTQEASSTRPDFRNSSASVKVSATKPAEFKRSIVPSRTAESSSMIEITRFGIYASNSRVDGNGAVRRRRLRLGKARATAGISRLMLWFRPLRFFGGQTETVRHPGQLDDRGRSHFFGDLAPVHLDRHLAQLELRCDLLVRTTGDDECENFPFRAAS